ncbi:YbdD/YjiX family protein [Streptomyces sp. NPDC006879]|uniref:YbdD/YjiX family protein n=1 Tax=Streptomyces sp. NPDC006879 TaxID=3364767 RepID=UPI003674E96F
MSPLDPRPTALSPLRSLRQVLSRVRWYVHEFTGEAAYDHYLAHVHRQDPGARALTRRAFERARTDAREGDPREGFRCC